MKLNQKVRYGLLCLFELSKHIGEYIDANFIAHQQGVPMAYAQKALQSMAHAGLVFSMKGAGYRLARPLSEITALEMLAALSKENDHASETFDMGFLLEQRINKALGSFTLSELVETVH
jgi:Rrf2 family protein